MVREHVRILDLRDKLPESQIMSTVFIEFLFILFLTIINGVFSMSEIALVSGRKARLQRLANQGNLRARVALQLANEPAEFLSTVQIGITLVGVMAGAFGGATIAAQLTTVFEQWPWIAPYGKPVAILIVVLITTYLSLVVGELVPKRIGLNNPERIAIAVASPMMRIARFAAPVVKLLGISTDAVLRLVRIAPSAGPPLTAEEIKILIEQATQAGVLEPAEQAMVENVFRLADRKVSLLMTQRADVVGLDLNDPVEAVRSKIAASGHSRYPVYEGTSDNVIGVVFTKDLLVHLLGGKPVDIKAVLKQPLVLVESARALKALELFKSSGNHIGFVVDEHGGFQGVLTRNDILEAVLGELATPGVPQAVRRDDISWLVDGLLPIDQFTSALGIGQWYDKQEGQYETVAGFVLSRLGHIPRTGEWLTVEDLRFEVVDMEGRRIDKILVSRITPSPASKS